MEEKAFVIASIKIRIDKEKKEAAKAKKVFTPFQIIPRKDGEEEQWQA